MRYSLLPAAVLTVLVLAACQPEAPTASATDAPAADGNTPATDPAPPATEAPAAPAPDTADVDATAVLAGKVWRVERSADVEVGSTYAFLEDGTLVIDSPNGTPLTGSWSVGVDGKLSMTEEGVTYPTDLVTHDADHITLRSHNPGGVVEFALVRAQDVPLPTPGAG